MMFLLWTFLWFSSFAISVPPPSHESHFLSNTHDFTIRAAANNGSRGDPSLNEYPSTVPSQLPSLTGGSHSPTLTARPTAVYNISVVPSMSPTTPAPSLSPSTPAPTKLPDTIKQITVNMTQGLQLGCLIEDHHNPAWGIDCTENENIFQLCRVLTLVFSHCSLADQQAANKTCSIHSQPNPALKADSSTSCVDECAEGETEAEKAAEWCQYSAIYVVFCSRSDRALTPGTTLQEMQELVQEDATQCLLVWNHSSWEDDENDDNDADHLLSSHADGSLGGALSALLATASVVVILVVVCFLRRKKEWCGGGQQGQALAGFDDSNSDSSFVDSVMGIETESVDTQSAECEHGGDGLGTIVSATKRRLSSIRKTSTYSSVSGNGGNVGDNSSRRVVRGGGEAGLRGAFSSPFSNNALVTDDNDEDEDFAEIFL